MAKAGKIMFFITLALAVLLGIGGVISFAIGFGSISSFARSAIAAGETTQVNLKTGDQEAIFTNPVTSRCTVTGPNGKRVLTWRTSSETFSSAHYFFHSNTSFAADQDGTYTVECSPTSRVFTSKTNSYTMATGCLSVGVFAIIASGFTFLLTLIWLVLWLVGRNKERQQSPQPYPGAAPPR